LHLPARRLRQDADTFLREPCALQNLDFDGAIIDLSREFLEALMSFRQNKAIYLSLAAAVILVGALLWVMFGTKPFTLVVLYDDVGGLRPGDPVLWKTFTVGKVDRVDPLVDNRIGVTIRLREDYAGQVTEGTEFVFKRASLMGLVGQNAIELRTPDVPGRPFTSGEKVKGQRPPLPALVEDGKRLAQEFWKQTVAQAEALVKEYQDSPYRKEVESALEELGVLAEQGVNQAKQGLDRFREEHQEEIDRLLKKLSDLRDRMRKAGDEQGARQVEKQIDALKSPPAK
jgi:ABC-type transporter Mla subunit MlaD